MIENEIKTLSSELFDRIVAIRRELHMHPELSDMEVNTAALVAETLRGWGISVQENIAPTGVVGIIHGTGPGKTLMLRADMDAADS